MRLWIESFSTCQILNREFIVREDFKNKTFRIIIFQRKTKFEKTSFEFNFWETRFRWKNHIWKNRFDSVWAIQSNRIFNFRAYFKEHDSEAKLFIENQSLKGNFWKKESDSEAFFFNKLRFWFENFSSRQILNGELFVRADFENKTFGIIKFWRKIVFEKTGFEFNYFG